MWTLAGFAKEMVAAAFWARGRQELAESNTGECRYLAHIEARCLQAALLLFVVGITFHIVRDMHLFLERGHSPRDDRSLVFRDWHHWWARYKALRIKYSFEIRMPKLIDAVCAAVAAIKGGSDQGNVISGLACQLRELRETDETRTLMLLIADRLADRIEPRL